MKKGKLVRIFILLILGLALTACGGGGGGDAPVADNTGNTGDTDNTGGGAAISGFDFQLSEGIYWEYFWSYEHSSSTSDGTDRDSDSGQFTITLGASTIVDGKTAFPVTIEGKVQDLADNRYVRDISHLALESNQLLGSTDGQTFETLFDANTGTWSGGGVFTAFATSTELEATLTTVENEFVGPTSAYTASRSASQSECETIAGYRVCPNDDSFTVSENEFYKPGIGPIGYSMSLSYSFGGTYPQTISTTKELGLVATSLTATDGFEPVRPPWEFTTDMPTPRIGHQAVALNGLIYVMGGISNFSGAVLSSVDIYNPETDSWSTGTSLPAGRSGFSAEAFGGKIYIFGGRTTNVVGAETSSVICYDPNTDSWDTMASIGYGNVSDMVNMTSAVSTSFIVLGLDNKTTVAVYDPAVNVWYLVTPSAPNSRFEREATAVGDDFYFIGGLNTATADFVGNSYRLELNSVGSSDTWTTVASMPTGRSSMVVEVVDGIIYSIAGVNYNQYIRDNEAYDPATDTWSTKSSLLSGRENAASTVVGGKIYVFGGRLGNEALVTGEVYDPSME